MRIHLPQSNHWPYRLGIAFIFVFFAAGGLFHFVATEVEMTIVPPYIPYPRVAVLASGVFEWVGALALLSAKTRRIALWGLFGLIVAVTPCHVYMLQYAERFHVPYWALVVRLPLQVALLALVAWCARRTGAHDTQRR